MYACVYVCIKRANVQACQVTAAKMAYGAPPGSCLLREFVTQRVLYNERTLSRYHYVQKYTHTHIRTYTHTHIRTYKHTHIHT